MSTAETEEAEAETRIDHSGVGGHSRMDTRSATTVDNLTLAIQEANLAPIYIQEVCGTALLDGSRLSYSSGSALVFVEHV
jgi:hypothetical protein